METQIINVNAIEVFEIKSKNHWVNSFPRALPQLPKSENLIWIDINGNSAGVGEDFMVAEKKATYPIKIYLLKRIAHDSNPDYFNKLLNLFK
jgi:hypothetical protein